MTGTTANACYLLCHQNHVNEKLYNIRHIRKYLTNECTEKLIHAFITSWLDHSNRLLYGVPDYHMQKLQRGMNASARLIFCAPKHCHITPLLQSTTSLVAYPFTDRVQNPFDHL